MKNLNLLWLSIMLVFTVLSGKAMGITPPNLKFGSPTREEMEMTTYDADPNATAVILSSTTNVSFYFKTILHQKRKVKELWQKRKIRMRIKMLKDIKNTYDCILLTTTQKGSIIKQKTFLYDVVNSDSHVLNPRIKATSWNIVDGNIVSKRIDSTLIYNDIGCGYMIPTSNKGTLIEYEYDSDIPVFNEIAEDIWYANSDLPILYTKYEVKAPKGIISNPIIYGESQLETKRLNGKATNNPTDIYVYEGRNLSAIITKRNILLKQSVPHVLVTMKEDIYYDRIFNGRLNHPNPLRKEMTAMGIYDIKNRKEQIDSCAQLLFSKVKWNGLYNIDGHNANDIIASGKGTNADINAIMINMLNDLGIKAVPVILEPRQNFLDLLIGKTFVVGIIGDDGKLCYFDGSAKYGYINVLPNDLPVKGRPLGYKNGTNDIVNIRETTESGCNITLESWLYPDKENDKTKIKMDVRYKYTGLPSMQNKEYYSNYISYSKAYIAILAKEFNAHLSEYSNEEANTYSPNFIEKFSASKEIKGSVIHGIDPFSGLPLRMPLYELKEEKCDVPIDLGSPISLKLNYIIHVPQGYNVQQLPQNASYCTTDKSATLKLVSTIADDCIVLKLNLSIKKCLFMPDEIPGLKEILDIFNYYYKSNGCYIKFGINE